MAEIESKTTSLWSARSDASEAVRQSWRDSGGAQREAYEKPSVKRKKKSEAARKRKYK